MKNKNRNLYTLLAGFIIFSFSNCGVVGLGIGSSMDSKKLKYELSADKLSEISKNRRVLIFLKNGEQLKGRFKMILLGNNGQEEVKFFVWRDPKIGFDQRTPIKDIDHVVVTPARNNKWIGFAIDYAVTNILFFLIGPLIWDFD